MEFYHVLNRGVEKRNIVLDDGDRMRFVRSMYLFNDSKPAPNAISQLAACSNTQRQRDCLVDVHAWCLMDNHYHLLLSPVDDDMTKLSLFIKKLNGGYAKFFNEKYSRSGYLWQGKTKKKHIEGDSYFLHIPYYIHMNPLDHKFKEWRDGRLQNMSEAIAYLDDYRWSSWQDYIGIHNFPSILYKKVLQDVLGQRNEQERAVTNIAQDETIAMRSNNIET